MWCWCFFWHFTEGRLSIVVSCMGVSRTGRQISRSACRCLPLVCLSAVTVTVCLRVSLLCFLIISSFPTLLPSLSSCHHLCLAVWITIKPEKGKEVTEPTCLIVTALRGPNQPQFLTIMILCLYVALLSPGEAWGAAALFGEGQSSYNEPLHKDLLHVNTCCKNRNPIMPLLLCHYEYCALRWHE